MANEITKIPPKGNKKRIIIVGGGFAGLKFARKLKKNKFQVILLDRQNHHIFQPLLYQVATSGVEPSAISFPFRKIFRKHKDFHLRMCEVNRVIPEYARVETSIGYLTYDYLIVSSGSHTNYFGNTKLSEQTMSLKTTADALYNRNKVLESLEEAQNTTDKQKRKQLMTYVIVGGGATGIELAGALAEMRDYLFPQDYPDLNIEEMQIILLDAGPRLLSNFSEKSSEKVKESLEKMGIEIRLNAQVKDYNCNSLTFVDGSQLLSANVYWVAGVKGNSLEGFREDTYGPGNRLLVNTYNQVKGYENIFALGDTALMITEEHPKGHPQVVQPAIQQAKHLAKNIERLQDGKELKPFKYRDKGSMATIGRNNAIVEMKNLHFGGFLGWLSWLFIHLINIVGVKNKLFIMLDWTWSYLRYDPSLRLIIKPINKEKENCLEGEQSTGKVV